MNKISLSRIFPGFLIGFLCIFCQRKTESPIVPIIARQISEHTGTDTTEFMDEMKDYIRKFQGKLFHMTTSESGGCDYIWYAPTNRFVTFYCP